MNASGECSRLYDEVSYYTLAHGRERFIHQHLVDAYGAQHVRRDSRSTIGGAFALGGLYLAIERGFNGRQVQDWHVRAARRSKEWPRFGPPADLGPITIADVHAAQPGPDRDQVLMQWCSSVWAAWAAERNRIREMVERWF